MSTRIEDGGQLRLGLHIQNLLEQTAMMKKSKLIAESQEVSEDKLMEEQWLNLGKALEQLETKYGIKPNGLVTAIEEMKYKN